MAPGRLCKFHAPSPPSAAHKLLIMHTELSLCVCVCVHAYLRIFVNVRIRMCMYMCV